MKQSLLHLLRALSDTRENETKRETTIYCSPDSSKLFETPCMICLIFPSASQLTLIGLLQARAKLSAFENENKVEKVIITIKRLNWSSFKEAPYRIPDNLNHRVYFEGMIMLILHIISITVSQLDKCLKFRFIWGMKLTVLYTK